MRLEAHYEVSPSGGKILHFEKRIAEIIMECGFPVLGDTEVFSQQEVVTRQRVSQEFMVAASQEAVNAALGFGVYVEGESFLQERECFLISGEVHQCECTLHLNPFVQFTPILRLELYGIVLHDP